MPSRWCVSLSYKHTGWTNYNFLGSVSGEKVDKLVAKLEEGLNTYLTLIGDWHEKGKLPLEFQNHVD